MWIFLRLSMLCILSSEIVVVESFEIVYSSDGMKNSVYDGDCVVLGWAGVENLYMCCSVEVWRWTTSGGGVVTIGTIVPFDSYLHFIILNI
jgi:hypothetical protein